MLPTPGQLIDNRYQVVREIGVGGMGIVYEVQGIMLANRFAMKLLKPDLARYDLIRERFWREAKIQSTIDHPNIAKVYDLVTVDGVPAIILEYLEGHNLGDWLDAGHRLTYAQIKTFAVDLAGALEAAHNQGAVHRDLKPDNVFLVDKGDRFAPKILDFGVAKVIDAAKLTVTDAFVGTYRYASPEQILESTGVDARSDLYSFGVLLWELLTGNTPYSNQTSSYAIQDAVLNEELGSLPHDTPKELEITIRKLLMKEKELRIQTAMGVIASIEGRYDENADRALGDSRSGFESDDDIDVDVEDENGARKATPTEVLDDPGSSYPMIAAEVAGAVERGELGGRVDYATAVRDDVHTGDYKFATAAYEVVASNSRARVLAAFLLFVIAGAIIFVALQVQRGHQAAADGEGSAVMEEAPEEP